MGVAGMIDAFIRHHWADQAEVLEFMPTGWQQYLGQPARLPGPLKSMPLAPMFPYRRPDGDTLAGADGSSYETLRDQVLDPWGVERAVLCHDLGGLSPARTNPYLARVTATAINDWTRERWLSRDERLSALLVVPNQTPDDGVAEIERLGDDPRIAGVLLAANGLSKPFGHPLYHPILAAAAERGLPVVIPAGGDAITETLSATMAAGMPSSYTEYAVFASQALATHLVSLIAEGVFVKYPDLRVLISGAGVAWMPSVLWRFDTDYAAYRRETPWLDVPPSEYLRRHVRICTYPLDVTARPEQLTQFLRAFRGLEDLLVFGSGYPGWDTDSPESIADRIPDEWRDKILRENAQALFRWDVQPHRETPPAADVGVV
jgi:predicted TIM-barrel fold metal-dependent hydrolase